MNPTSHNLFRVLIALALQWPRTTAAQSPATQPYVWRNVAIGGGGGGAALSATPGIEGDLWLASRNEGLFHSTNGGASFAKLPAVQSANSFGLGKAAPGKDYPALYLAGRINQLQALFRSADSGLTWVRINDDAHQFGYISRLTGDPRIFGRVYFATGGRGVIYGDPAPVKQQAFN